MSSGSAPCREELIDHVAERVEVGLQDRFLRARRRVPHVRDHHRREDADQRDDDDELDSA